VLWKIHRIHRYNLIPRTESSATAHDAVLGFKMYGIAFDAFVVVLFLNVPSPPIVPFAGQLAHDSESIVWARLYDARRRMHEPAKGSQVCSFPSVFNFN